MKQYEILVSIPEGSFNLTDIIVHSITPYYEAEMPITSEMLPEPRPTPKPQGMTVAGLIGQLEKIKNKDVLVFISPLDGLAKRVKEIDTVPVTQQVMIRDWES